MSSSTERLNNAIVRAAQVGGPGSDAWTLNEDWQDWFETDLWRSLGPLGVPFVAGTLQGFHDRYQTVYLELPAAQRAQLQRPQAVEPTPTSDATAQAIEANEAVYRKGRDAAQAGADELRSAAKRVGRSVYRDVALGAFVLGLIWVWRKS